MGRLTAAVRPRAEIGSDEADRMYQLFARYYDAVSPQAFCADLDAKDCVIELRDGAELCGFSTIALIDFQCGGVEQRAIFSGDTVIDRPYWGERTLPVAFCEFAGRVYAAAPEVPLYWLLITKGYRTYRYLSLLAQRFYPHPDEPTPPEEQACMDALARLRFGDAYQPQRGILHFEESRGHLRPQWADVRESVSRRADVRFFLERNPGYRAGDELVCLTRLAADNLKSFARRAFERGMHDPARVAVL